MRSGGSTGQQTIDWTAINIVCLIFIISSLKLDYNLQLDFTPCFIRALCWYPSGVDKITCERGSQHFTGDSQGLATWTYQPSSIHLWGGGGDTGKSRGIKKHIVPPFPMTHCVYLSAWAAGPKFPSPACFLVIFNSQSFWEGGWVSVTGTAVNTQGLIFNTNLEHLLLRPHRSHAKVSTKYGKC